MKDVGYPVEELASRVRAALNGMPAVRETRMFGGIAFMLHDRMMAAASRHGLLLRIGKQREAEALSRMGTRPMVMRDRRMTGYIYVDPRELTAASLQRWLEMAKTHVQSLGPKSPAARMRARLKARG